MAEEVSGQAAFWILLSLATATIAQPTRSWRRKERDLFGGHVDLARCIPTVCFIDAVCDIIFLGISARRSLSTSNPAPTRQRILPKASELIVKLALSVFTVLPQTIKVFSLKGVPGTQICACLFFLAFTTKLVVDICGLDEEEEEDQADSVETKDDSLDIIVLAAVLLQTPFEIWIWRNISYSGALQAPPDLAALCTWSASFCLMTMALQTMIWIMYVVVRKRFDITGSPHMVPKRGSYILLMVLGAAKTAPRVDKDKSFIVAPPKSFMHYSHGLSLMCLTAVVSLVITKVLDLGIRALLSEKKQLAVPTLDGQSTTSENSAVKSEDETSTPPPGAPPIGWVGKIGTVIDRWVERVLTARSAATITIMLAVFNLITTIVYYLVCFDGTGTENPSWTSLLG